MNTPRTDEAYELACGDVDREIQDGWDLARKLELELRELQRSIGHAMKKEYNISELFS